MIRDTITTGETAKLMGVSPKTVVRWCDEGRLPALKTLGGHRRIPREVVAKLLAAQWENPWVPMRRVQNGSDAQTVQ